ncbi:MAG: 2-amino-4-hydroxy-6-hydroxymethyldihydropteridine diphosphokinase [Succinivibrionaceae bacterium]|nr:2-amino-4-hydroxy-6-hydroxymethyldihydropteridine diphosphokinase [Succinivibrionaceae bacterium]
MGSNLNRDNALRFAVAKLREAFGDIRVSSVWQSHAVRAAEPDYYNLVVGLDTDRSLEDLLEAIGGIEAQGGREMMFHNSTNFGSKRRLDIDVLLYGETVCTTPCKLPRHDIQDYPFVLAPLCELDPEILHPLLKIKVKEIWSEMAPRLPEKMRVTKISDFDWNAAVPDWQ